MFGRFREIFASTRKKSRSKVRKRGRSLPMDPQRRLSRSVDFLYEAVTAEDLEESVNLDETGRFSGIRNISNSSAGFVQGLWFKSTLLELNSCQFELKSGTLSRTHYFRKQGTHFLYTCDEEGFMARIQLDLNNLPADLMKSDEILGREIFSRMKIVRIGESLISDATQKTFEELESILETKSKETATDLTSAEDLLRLSLNLENSKNVAELLKSTVSDPRISEPLKSALFSVSHIEQVFSKYIRDSCPPEERKNLPFPDLLETVQEILEKTKTNHSSEIFKEFSQNSAILTSLRTEFNSIETRRIFFVRKSDLDVFASIFTIHPNVDFLAHLWRNFLETISSEITFELPIKEQVPRSHDIFPFLLKSYIETIDSIVEQTKVPFNELFVEEKGKLGLNCDVKWSKEAISTRTVVLEEQYRALNRLLDYFSPGKRPKMEEFDFGAAKLLEMAETIGCLPYKSGKSARKKKRMQLSDTSIRRIWLWLIETNLIAILNHKSQQQTLSSKQTNRLFELATNLVNAFIKFSQKEDERNIEKYRVAAKNFIDFAACVTFKDSNMTSTILKRQMKQIKRLTHFEDGDTDASSLPGLIDLYRQYWDQINTIFSELERAQVDNVFRADFEAIEESFRHLVDASMSKQVGAEAQVEHFRALNEFFKQFRSVRFDWLVKGDRVPRDLMHGEFFAVLNADYETYEVIQPAEFVEELEERGVERPRHYKIEVVKKLIGVLHKVLKNSKWEDAECLEAANHLLFAIGYSFRNFEFQKDYVEFENFWVDSTSPFDNVVKNSNNLIDFKKRIGNVENFYLYTRKLDEIDIEKSLLLLEEEAEQLQIIGFPTSLDVQILRRTYKTYASHLTRYLESQNIENIAKSIKTLAKQFQGINFPSWTAEMKQNLIPTILAGLSAIWSILESKDFIGTGKWLKPHTIQILCILRLLSIDRTDSGVLNHLAQVLTGQGKSIILGLLSAVFALLGFNVRVACYNRYLSTRDQQDFDAFFKQIGLSEQIRYGTFFNLANDVLTLKTDRGERIRLRELVERILMGEFAEEIVRPQISVDRTILLIDEVDVFFDDLFYGNTYSQGARVKFEAIGRIQIEIWRLVCQERKEKEILDEINGRIQEFTRDDEKFLYFYAETRHIFDYHLKLMVTEAIQVANDSFLISDFKIDSHGKICVKNNFGVFVQSAYKSYLNIFAYFRLKVQDFDHKSFFNFGYLNIWCGSISYAKLPQEYPLILGVTGTLTCLGPTEKEAIQAYNIGQISSMPSFFGRHKLIFDKDTHFILRNSEAEWQKEIHERVRTEIDKGRAVLVFFDSEIELNAFKRRFSQNFARLNSISGNEKDEKMRWLVAEAGVAQTVTLCSRHMGRGTDFKVSDSRVEERGGVHVIQTFFSDDLKFEIQIRGRTARKDNRGSYELIINREHLTATEKQLKRIDYDALDAERWKRVEAWSKEMADRVKASEKWHQKTMDFVESLSNYRANKRPMYMSRFPFVDN